MGYVLALLVGFIGGAAAVFATSAPASARLARVTGLMYIDVVMIAPFGRITALPAAARQECP